MDNDYDLEDIEWMAADMSARPFLDIAQWIDEADLLHPNPPWEIDSPMRYRSMGDVSFPAHPEHAKAITVLAYHLWKIWCDVSGESMADHKTGDPMRIEWDGEAFNVHSYVWSEVAGEGYESLQSIETALLNAFTDLMGNLITHGRKTVEDIEW